MYTGRQHVASDSKGNLHFTWYQRGNPDDYEIYYTRALVDTSGGIIAYNVERPAFMISSTNGEMERFASMTLYEDTLIMVTWTVGDPPNSVGYNYSLDGGNTWLGPFVAYDHGGPMPGSWQLCSVASDPNTGDMWAAVPFDYTGNVNMDIVALHWNFAAGDTWEHELVIEGQPEPHNFPQCGPIIAVDYNSNPHIIFQENFAPGGGMSGGLYGFSACGPCGTIFYTYRIGAGNWKAPVKIKFPRYEVCNYESGLPSVGIATDNTIYFSVTQPESATADTNSAILPFNVHYAKVAPYTGDVSYGGLVSDISTGSLMNAIYGQITSGVPLGGEVPVVCTPGPGITWAQMEAATPPTDIYYVHKDTLPTGIEEEPVPSSTLVILYQSYPNPFSTKAMIRFTIPDNIRISLGIYDISGRLIKTLAKGIPGAGSYFVVWDGKDDSGHEVPNGVYLYSLRAGSYTETRKMLLIH
jgi:hypothetical protein